jgi:hypothetical protein
MTLKEKFIDAFKSGKRFDIKNAEVIADEFAIGFADWLRVNYYDNGDFWIAWDNDKETKTSKELLEIYKKEKGL